MTAAKTLSPLPSPSDYKRPVPSAANDQFTFMYIDVNSAVTMTSTSSLISAKLQEMYEVSAALELLKAQVAAFDRALDKNSSALQMAQQAGDEVLCAVLRLRGDTLWGERQLWQQQATLYALRYEELRQQLVQIPPPHDAV